MAPKARIAMPATPASLVSFIQFPPPIRQVDRWNPFDLGRRPPPPRPDGGLAPSGALPFGLSSAAGVGSTLTVIAGWLDGGCGAGGAQKPTSGGAQVAAEAMTSDRDRRTDCKAGCSRPGDAYRRTTCVLPGAREPGGLVGHGRDDSEQLVAPPTVREHPAAWSTGSERPASRMSKPSSR